MDTNAAHLDDPQSTVQSFPLQHIDGVRQRAGDRPAGLSPAAQVHDSAVGGRRIALYVGEIQVKRDKGTAFALKDLDEVRIARTSKRLIENRVRLVAC